jgi:chemotaxis protein MotA
MRPAGQRGAIVLHEESELSKHTKPLDLGLLVGIAIALCAVSAGVMSTGVGLRYFLQPTGALIVLGGTLGVVLVTTPLRALKSSARRVRDLVSHHTVDREKLIEEIIQCARVSRRGGILSLQPVEQHTSNRFLQDALMLAMDVRNREELQTALELDLRLRERQGEADAKTLEVAGGFAPTIGILGTVVGLIEVLRQFSNIPAVGFGIGTAFLSTIYGLALANLVLLPMAHRIRSRVAEAFEIQELMMEGVLYLVDGVHPSLMRMKLNSFLRDPIQRPQESADGRQAVASGANG